MKQIGDKILNKPNRMPDGFIGHSTLAPYWHEGNEWLAVIDLGKNGEMYVAYQIEDGTQEWFEASATRSFLEKLISLARDGLFR